MPAGREMDGTPLAEGALQRTELIPRCASGRRCSGGMAAVGGGPVEAAVAGFPEEEEEEEVGCYDFEPLPRLLEDEENVSLADILSLRDSCLTEQDIWAICLECSHSMKSISHSAIFQTLCITPDTLAFNTNGNVCFMEQLSDDPEGAFVPPEFDITGLEGLICGARALSLSCLTQIKLLKLEKSLKIESFVNACDNRSINSEKCQNLL
ncbi:Protein very KIND [Chelonia mydas]|uniref:Protein very KIND n=1 Tax=Chelonia mydas TaxID=8469 RepID=M7CLU3_CHEMY|nr:Protein very KIND [Chelonia mydas]